MAFVERKLEVVTWDEKGKKVAGRLKGIVKLKFNDGGVGLRYNVRQNDGTMIEFLGSSNINSKLAQSDIGCNIHVEYVGEDTSRTMSDGKNRPKLFKVMVDESSREQTVAADGTQITDEDIPF